MSDESTVDSDVEIDEPDETQELEASEEVVEEEGESEEVTEVHEFDFGGTKHQVPVGASVDEVADSLQEFATSIHGDYTKKTQTLAEQTKEIETAAERLKADRAAVDKLSNLQGEAFGTFSQGLQLKAEIEQLQGAMSNELWQSDPDQARMLSDRLSAKQAEFLQVQNTVSAQELEFQKAQEQDVARRTEEGKQLVQSKVKDFDADAVVDYAVKTYGIPAEEAARWPLNPVSAIMAHKAMKFDEMQTKAASSVKKVVKPVQAPKGKGAKTTSTDLNDPKMSSKEWFKLRQKQMREARP